MPEETVPGGTTRTRVPETGNGPYAGGLTAPRKGCHSEEWAPKQCGSGLSPKSPYSKGPSGR